MFKRNIYCDGDNLNKLRQIQSEIVKLESITNMPRLGYYCASTRTFPRGDEDALNYILMVIQGMADPLHLPYRGKEESSIQFWNVFSKYFKEIANYCEDRENRLSKIKDLKSEEKRLKEVLNIR